MRIRPAHRVKTVPDASCPRRLSPPPAAACAGLVGVDVPDAVLRPQAGDVAGAGGEVRRPRRGRERPGYRGLAQGGSCPLP